MADSPPIKKKEVAMSEVANIYDNGPISPICRIKDNLSIWSGDKWNHYRVDFIEGITRSSPMTVDMVLASGATVIAANGIIMKQVVPILQMNLLELLHLRWEPLDDVEGLLWELGGQARFTTRGAHARVSMFTSMGDPFLATTTFYIIGQNRDMNLEVRNPNPVAMAMARFVFFGYRYIITELPTLPSPTTYLPAQGR